jgi:hypothetical protein
MSKAARVSNGRRPLRLTAFAPAFIGLHPELSEIGVRPYAASISDRSADINLNDGL